MFTKSLLCLLNDKGYKTEDHKNYIVIDNRPVRKENILGYGFKTEKSNNGERKFMIILNMINDQTEVF